ncbi:MAG: single-stranded DNA-binding protein [Dehalococcoidia bacterium]
MKTSVAEYWTLENDLTYCELAEEVYVAASLAKNDDPLNADRNLSRTGAGPTARETQERTEWDRIIAWANLADLAERYLRKGDRVYLEGEIQYRSYEDREGVTRYVTEICARELIMLGGRNGDRPADKVPAREPAAVGSAAASDGSDVPDVPEDHLPF